MICRILFFLTPLLTVVHALYKIKKECLSFFLFLLKINVIVFISCKCDLNPRKGDTDFPSHLSQFSRIRRQLLQNVFHYLQFPHPPTSYLPCGSQTGDPHLSHTTLKERMRNKIFLLKDRQPQ